MTRVESGILLLQNESSAAVQEPSDELRALVVELARLGNGPEDRSAALFQSLRKANSKDFTALLGGVHYLAADNDPLGARLLAAFLSVGTAGDRLLPRVETFRSARRLRQQIMADRRQTMAFQRDWLRRLDDLVQRARHLVQRQASEPETDVSEGRDTWALLGQALRILLDKLDADEVLDHQQRTMLGNLIELEVDAWQERISRLAGQVDPFRVVWVARMLPILAEADVLVRDLRQLIGWIREGNFRRAFRTKNSRASEVLDAKEMARLHKLLADRPELSTLHQLFEAQIQHPLTLNQLATATADVLALMARLHRNGWRSQAPDLLTALLLVRQQVESAELALPLDQDDAVLVEQVCDAPEDEAGAVGWGVRDSRVISGQLVVGVPDEDDPVLAWPDDLPLPQQDHPAAGLGPDAAAMAADEATEVADEAEEEEEKDPLDSGTAIKHLVMTNLQSTSILLGFLRNPKITAVPGLVADVATRTRNPQIIETIATDRALYNGFANRDVPLACLRNPTNVSVNVLRKFIHVKYVSKVELRRMARDTAGLRKEVIREINLYLETLG